jgi:hypothetical protein
MKNLTALQERRIIVTINEPIEEIAKELNTSTAIIHQLRLKLCNPKKKLIPVKSKKRRNKAGFKHLFANKTPKIQPVKIKKTINKVKPMIQGMKYISTLEWGYWIRQYKCKKVSIGKTFRFSNYSNTEDCLIAAQIWRNNNIVEADFSRPLRKEPMPSNKLQIAGVYKTVIYRKDQETPYFRAFWTKNKKQRTKYFNIDKYGKKKALELAVTCRNEAVQRINQ